MNIISDNHRLFSKLFILIISSWFYLNGTLLQCQNRIISGDSIVLVENTMKKLDKNVNFTVLPAPIYNSSQKLGLAVLPVIVYDISRKDTLSPPSSTGLGIYFDFYGSWMVAVKQTLFWNQNKWRAAFGNGYGHLEQKFFGIGRDTVIINNHDSNYMWTNLDGLYLTATCYRKIWSNLFAGLQYNFYYTSLYGSDSASSAELTAQGIDQDYLSESILIPSFVWDSRDNIYWTINGYYAGLNFQLANKVIRSSYDYSILSGFANGYYPLIRHSKRLTLGWHFNFQLGWGDISYTQLSMFGRGDNSTGYTRGKYVNNSEVAAQTEIRYDLWKFIGVGGYVGTGKVFHTLETFGHSVWLPFGGARFYLNVIPSRNFRFRLDVAVARQDYGIYIGVGQGF